MRYEKLICMPGARPCQDIFFFVFWKNFKRKIVDNFVKSGGKFHQKEVNPLLVGSPLPAPCYD